MTCPSSVTCCCGAVEAVNNGNDSKAKQLKHTKPFLEPQLIHKSPLNVKPCSGLGDLRSLHLACRPIPYFFDLAEPIT